MKEYKIKINGNDYAVSVGEVEEGLATVTVNGVEYTAGVEGTVSRPRAPKPQPVATPAVPANRNAAPAGATRPAAPAAPKATAPAPSAPAASAAPKKAAGASIKSPLPGVILEVTVQAGDVVKVGQKVMALEAMKMENNIDSDVDGVVRSVEKKKGDSVLEGDVLITFE